MKSRLTRISDSAKYALATCDKVIDTFGKDQLTGHDIACSFKSTIAHSSISQKAKDMNFMLTVNAFHGHAHNRICQLLNHPLFRKILGIEDFETCERIFSSSNALARVIRFASYFHWLQFLDLHFDQWDCDRYLELCTS